MVYKMVLSFFILYLKFITMFLIIKNKPLCECDRTVEGISVVLMFACYKEDHTVIHIDLSTVTET